MTGEKTNGRIGALAAIAAIAAIALISAACGKPKAAGNASPQGGGQGYGQGAPAAGAAAPGGIPGSGGQRQGGAAQGGSRRSAVIPVQAMAVKTDTLIASRSTAGVVSPVLQSQIATQVAGVVKRVDKSVGDWVKAGEVIVELEDAQLRITLSNAQFALQNAQINLSSGQSNSEQAGPKLSLQLQSAQSALDSATKYYQSQKALFDLGGITAAQLDTASSQLSAAQANLESAKTALSQNANSGDQAIAQLRLAVEQAQNQVEQAKLNLRNAAVRAPFAGQIAALNLQPGMYAGLNTPVLTLVSSERRVAFNVSPSDAPFLTPGKALTFSAGGVAYPVRIGQSPSAPISGVVPMTASLTGPQLPYGTVGNVDYDVPLAKGVIVPIAALSTLEDRNFVFAVEAGRATEKFVSIIAESGTLSAVSGLSDGDIVIVNPPPGLLQGSQVQPNMMPAAGASTSPAAAPQAGQAQRAGAPAPGGAAGGQAPARTGGFRQGGAPGATGGQSGQGGQGGGFRQGGQGGRNRAQASASPEPEASKQ